METNELLSMTSIQAAVANFGKEFLSQRLKAWEQQPADPTPLCDQVTKMVSELDINETEDNALIALFLQRFAAQYASREQMGKIITTVALARGKFPVVDQTSQTLSELLNESRRFFVSSGDFYANKEHAFSLPALPNPLANTIIETECKRMQIDFQRPELKNDNYQIKPSVNNGQLIFNLSKN